MDLRSFLPIRTRQFFYVLLWLYYCVVQLQSYLFTDLSYDVIKNQSLALQSASLFTLVNTAQELYNIPAVRSGTFECSPHIIRVTDRTSLASDVTRPQIFVSGEIHGDERVGPLASIVTAQLLVHSARCVVEKHADACDFLEQFGQLTAYQRKWLAFLATRRDTIVVPTANCLGYQTNRREDAGGVDPNRDFAYTRRDSRCFLSTTAKIIYAIMKEHIIQVVVTFHGGMVAIGYEWGSPNHHSPNDASPDHAAYSNIGKFLSSYGGRFKRERAYPVGQINSVIYPVDGGMEDWLYAEGWDPKFLTPDCQGYNDLFSYLKRDRAIQRPPLPSSSSPSSSSLTGLTHPRLRSRPRKMLLNPPLQSHRHLAEVPNGNRAIVFLVETSDAKKPSTDSLGGTEHLLHPNSPQNGHIPRNIRLTLSAIDLLQPYTCFKSIHLLHSPEKEVQLTADWYVGGAFEVDETFLTLTSFGPSPPSLQTTQDFTAYLRYIADDVVLEKAVKSPGESTQHRRGEMTTRLISSVMKGATRWTFQQLNDLSNSNPLPDAEVLQPAKVYQEKVSLQQQLLGMIRGHVAATKTRSFSFWLIAWSKVDAGFGRVGQGHPSDSPPQSHYSNIRTNSDWNCSFVGKEYPRSCQGRKYWPSDFVEIEVDLNEGRITVKKEVLDCAWWDLQAEKGSKHSFSFVVPAEWKLLPVESKPSTALDTPPSTKNDSIKNNEKDSYAGNKLPNTAEDHVTSAQQSSSPLRKNDTSSLFIPYHVFHRTEEASFFTVERTYLMISLLLTVLITIGVLVANQVRRNRIYNALVTNRYLSLPTGFQR